MPYDGSPTESLVRNVRTAYAMEKQAGYAARTLFCINKCGRDDFKNGSFADSYKKDFVGKIKREINATDYVPDNALQKFVMTMSDGAATRNDISDMIRGIREKESEMKAYILDNLKYDDFMFTDQLHQDPSRGVKGPREVKERIKQYLVEMEIYSEEEVTDLF